MMKRYLVAGASALVLAIAGQLATPAPAHAAAWCAWYDAYSRNCGFHTFQQCLDTISGAGGVCRPNVEERAYRRPRAQYIERGAYYNRPPQYRNNGYQCFTDDGYGRYRPCSDASPH